MTTDSIRVLIVDDYDMLREGLAAFIKASPDLTLVGEAANGNEAVEQCIKLKPDVVLMDLMMPVKDGITAIAEIRVELPDTRIIALSSFSDDKSVQSALKAGATSYLLKNISATQLADSIRSAVSGFATLAPEVAGSALSEESSARKDAAYDLTQREQQVLHLLAEGLSNAEIAQQLEISKYTVKNYVSNILGKLEVGSRTEAVSLALKESLF